MFKFLVAAVLCLAFAPMAYSKHHDAKKDGKTSPKRMPAQAKGTQPPSHQMIKDVLLAYLATKEGQDQVEAQFGWKLNCDSAAVPDICNDDNSGFKYSKDNVLSVVDLGRNYIDPCPKCDEDEYKKIETDAAKLNRIAGESRRYAIIIGGDLDSRYWDGSDVFFTVIANFPSRTDGAYLNKERTLELLKEQGSAVGNPVNFDVYGLHSLDKGKYCRSGSCK